MRDVRRLPSPIRFGVFEVDPLSGELRRQGSKVKLQEQPYQVLMMLLQRPGQVVTREEFQQKLWTADTFVDFERGLNRAVNKLREALLDDADTPRFIETLPRRGYRFVASVEAAGTGDEEGTGKSPISIVPADTPRLREDSDNSGARPRVAPWVIAGVLAIISLVVFWKPWAGQPITVERPFLQLDLDVGPDEFSQPAVSPDGLRVVFVSRGSLAMRRLDQTMITRLAGTEDASSPFFSPNGQWIAFYAGRKLQKVAVEGGAPIVLCDAPGNAGGAWGPDNTIVAALSQGLFRVPAAGGKPQPITDPSKDPSGRSFHRSPQILPGGSVLFAAVSANGQGSLRILAPDGGRYRTVVENSSFGRYLPGGYLVYYQRETLFAAAMDPSRLELTSPAVPLVSAVSAAGDRADFDLSNSGVLVYRHGAAATILPSWLYQTGKIEPALAPAGIYLSARLSPNGTRLALSEIQDGLQRIWIHDLERQSRYRLTSEDESEWLPTWTPDGEFIAFHSTNALAWASSDGSGKVERLAGVNGNAGPWSFSNDGRWLAFWPLQPRSDLWVVPVERRPGVLRMGEPRALLQQAGSKGAPALSPDGRWLAYSSSLGDGFEVFVMPVSSEMRADGHKWMVSSGGGHSPIWSRNGRQLFYQDFDRRVRVANCSVKRNLFVAERPRLWCAKQLADTGFSAGYDVAPDGKRVLALLPAAEIKPETIMHVLLNVDSELRRRVLARGK